MKKFIIFSLLTILGVGFLFSTDIWYEHSFSPVSNVVVDGFVWMDEYLPPTGSFGNSIDVVLYDADGPILGELTLASGKDGYYQFLVSHFPNIVFSEVAKITVTLNGYWTIIIQPYTGGHRVNFILSKKPIQDT
ncbi:MAG: hypothetical protein FWG98_15845 [Candidatus Cloacimonetes bacterium]|nr:hypothetical protein [Candidatus Cloacimonadota bacterium]